MKKAQNLLQNETEVMKVIATEFEKLPKESQQRVVNWLLSIVGNSILPLNNLQASEKNLPSQVGVIGPAYQRGEDAKEFFLSKQPKNNQQKLAVLGYYLEFMKSKDEFNTQDLKIAWKQTREALPNPQVFSNSLNATLTTYKYFVSGEERGLYRLGIKGQQLVETLPAQPKGLAVTVKKKRKGLSSNRRKK